MRKRILGPILLLIAILALAGCGGGGGVEVEPGALAGYVYVQADARGLGRDVVILPEPTRAGNLVPLSGALVKADGPSLGQAYTDVNGYFIVDGLRPGYYTIMISHPQFTGLIGENYYVASGVTTDCEDWSLGSFHFLFVAVNDYQNPDVNDLSYAEADATLMRDRLYSSNYLAGQYDILLGNQATKANIKGAIDTIKARLNYADKFVFSFSGHGSQDGSHEYFCPYDTNLSTVDSMISDAEIQSWVAGFPSHRCVLIFDSCFSGGMYKAPGLKASNLVPSALTEMARNLAGAGFIVMTACDKYEYSYESGTIGHGLFTYYLARGMETMAADANRNGVCTAVEAFNYARTQTQSETYYEQNPQIYRGTSGTNDLWLYEPAPL